MVPVWEDTSSPLRKANGTPAAPEESPGVKTPMDEQKIPHTHTHVTLRTGHQDRLLSRLRVHAVQPEVRVGDDQLTAAVQANAVRTTAHGLKVRAAA